MLNVIDDWMKSMSDQKPPIGLKLQGQCQNASFLA